jgi:thiosulfate dehydrogenase (quinone) large subunit
VTNIPKEEQLHQKHYRRVLIALIRVSMGWVFLWAFLDKLLGLGFATCKTETGTQFMCSKAWLAGGSPTQGFLIHGTSGPFASWFQAIQSPVVDWLFMIGLLGIGLALILGIGMRIAAYSGSIMLVLMYLAALPENNPLIDDHIIYAMVLLLLSWVHAGYYYGLGRWWHKLAVVQKNTWLQ